MQHTEEGRFAVRFTMLVVCFGALLATCGQVITIALPGTPMPVAQAVPETPVTAPLLTAPAAVPDGYERLFTATSYGFRPSGPGEPVRRGVVSERFELRVGDCDGSDCANGRARAEIREVVAAARARLNRDIWYGYSFLNVNIGSVTKATSPGAVFGQWKLDGDQPPVFRITQKAAGQVDFAACDPAVCSQIGAVTDDVVVELEDMFMARRWGPAQNNGAVCRLFNMQAAQGMWMDIVVNTNFATDETGYLRIWVNGELRCSYVGQLVSPTAGLFGPVGVPTHRRGIFAANTARFAAQPSASGVPGMIVYYDEFLVGRSRDDVDTRLREANSAPAND